MRLHSASVLSVVIVLAVSASCRIIPIPDLSPAEAAEIIARAPEFNRYHRLVKVDSVYHAEGSADTVSVAQFSLLYLGDPPSAPLMKGKADFRYHEGRWYLNEFDFGCPTDCHIINVNDGPDRHRNR